MFPTPFGLRPFPPDRGNRPHPPEKIQRPCVGADVPIRPPNQTPLLRLVATGALSPSSWTAVPILPASGSGAEAGAISCTTRAGFVERLPGSVPRNGGPGAGDWSAGAPRSHPPGIFGSFHPWKERKKRFRRRLGGISLTSMFCRPLGGWISDQRGTCL